jgi:hypothetical protein
VTDELDVELPPAFDERAVRRAVVRGVARSGLASLAWLMVLVLVLWLVTAGVGVARGDHFYVVTYNGMRAAHPEYEMAQDGGCCVQGPLFGLTNLGLASSMTFRVRPAGELDHARSSTVVVSQDVTGDFHANVGNDPTPLGDAWARGRPSKRSTVEFLDGLPAVVVSALVEFDRPVPAGTIAAHRGGAVFVTDPYEAGRVAWPTPQIQELRDWADQLRPADDGRLDEIGLPPSADIQRAAATGLVHAYVLPRAQLDEIRAMLADPAIRSVNILDVAFDTGRQGPE